MTFKELKVGQWFDFITPTGTSFYGRCRKLSTRRYESDGHIYRVGTIHAEVYHVA